LAEYLRRYDRYLDLYERSLAQVAEYNRLLAEDVRARGQQAQAYERQVDRQRWGIALFALGIVALAAVLIISALIRSG
jgi:hypothetical protein